MAKLLIKWFQVVTLTFGLLLGSSSWADDNSDVDVSDKVRPGMGTIMIDVLVARPLGLIATVGGSAIFVVTLPITLPTGTVGEAGMSLVAEPAMSTFARCLGCTEVGWRKLPNKDLTDE